MIEQTLQVRAVRRYTAAPERIFDAFTHPENLNQWFSPSDDYAVDVREYDLSVGGNYRICFRNPAGEENFVLGKFHRILSPTNLVFTWTWAEPDPHAGVETLVTVEIIPLGAETEVRVLHERFPNEEIQNRHNQGWNGTLERLFNWLG